MRKDLFLLGIHIGLIFGIDHERQHHHRKSEHYLRVDLGAGAKHMIAVAPGAQLPINLTLHQKNGEKETRGAVLSNVVVTLTPKQGAFGSLTAPDATGAGGNIAVQKLADGAVDGDNAELLITAHAAFPDGEEYNVALKNSDGELNKPELLVINDAEGGDFITVTLGVVPETTTPAQA